MRSTLVIASMWMFDSEALYAFITRPMVDINWHVQSYL